MRSLPFLYLSALVLLLICGVIARNAIVLNSNSLVRAQSMEHAATTNAEPNSKLGAKENTLSSRWSEGPPIQDALKDKTDAMRDEESLRQWLTTFQWILGLIITVAGLFTVAQGIAAGFSASRFTQLAEEGLKNIEKTSLEVEELKSGALSDIEDLNRAAVQEIDDLRKGIEAQYPDFLQKLAKMRGHAQQLLEDQLLRSSPVESAEEGYNQQLDFYAKIPIAVRQTIHSVERALPYEIAGQREQPLHYSIQLQRLARFYWSKFQYERRLGLGYLGDLERAEYLLSEGLSGSENAFTFHNDLGSVNMDFYRVMLKAQDIVGALRYFNRAEDEFLKSMELQSRQFRAYFNLAVIEAEHRGKHPEYFGADVTIRLHKALNYLQIGFRQGGWGKPAGGSGGVGALLWETKPVPAYVCIGYFNQACYHARLAVLEAEHRSEYAARCVESLGNAAILGLMRPEDVDAEFAKTEGFEGRKGDFWDLLQIEDLAVRPEIESLRRQLSSGISSSRTSAA